MRNPLVFKQVRNQSDFDATKRFAKEFAHDIDTSMPVVTMERDGRKLGYYQLLQQPVVIMAFHPDCSPRDFKEMSETVMAHRKLSSMNDIHPEGVCYTLVGEDSPVPKEAVEKLGFRDTGLKLFVA